METSFQFKTNSKVYLEKFASVKYVKLKKQQ